MSCTTTNIVRIRIRRDTAARWNSFNPVLCLGEIGYDSTINNLKIGDGVKKWSQLNYLAGGTGGTVWGGIIGNITDQTDLVDYINSIIGTGGGDFVPLAGTNEITGNLLANITSWILGIGDGSKAQVLISNSMVRLQKASPDGNKIAQIIVENDNASLNNISLQIQNFTTGQTKSININAVNGIRIGGDVLKYDADRSTLIDSTQYAIPSKEWVEDKIGEATPNLSAVLINGNNAGGYQIKNSQDGIEDLDLVTKRQLNHKVDQADNQAFNSVISFAAPFKNTPYTQTGNIVFSLAPTGNVDDTFGYLDINGNTVNSCSFPTDWINANGGTFDNTKKNHLYFHYLNGKVRYNIINSPLADTTAPTVASATVENATPNVITLTYNESLLTSSVPANTDFVASGGRTVSSVNVSGVTVSLTVNTPYAYGDVITVSYTGGTNKIQDLAGNIAANLSSQAVTNNVSFVDTTAPFVSSAQVANASPSNIQITFNEALLTTPLPATGDFAASGGKSVTGVSISGSVVTVTVNTPYVNGDVITVSYTGGTNKIKDLAGNIAANFSNQSVTNNVAVVDTTAPVLSTAFVNNATPNQIELTYNEALLTTPLPATGDFAVSGGKTVSSVAIAGTKVTLTANSSYAFGDTIIVSYTGGANKIKDLAGNNAANLISQPVTNNISAGDVTAPVISSATISSGAPNQITLLYNEALLTSSVPATGDFAISGKTISSVAISGSTVTITLSASVISGDVITVSYTGGANKIKDLAGNNAANLTNYPVVNNSTVFGNLTSLNVGADVSKILQTTAASPNALSMAGNWCYTIKVKSSPTGANQFLFELGSPTQPIFTFFLGPTGNVCFLLWSTPTSYTAWSSSNVLSTSTWSTIVLTGTGNNTGSVDMWINNVGLTGSLTHGTVGSPTSIKTIDADTRLTVGRSLFFGAAANSLIDEIGFFNYRFNSTNATELWNSGVTRNLLIMSTFVPPLTNFLQGYWRFENNYLDSSVNGLNLSLASTGTPAFSTDRP